MAKKYEYFILVNKKKNTIAEVSPNRALLQAMLDSLSKKKPLLASEWKIESRISYREVKEEKDFKDFEKF